MSSYFGFITSVFYISYYSLVFYLFLIYFVYAIICSFVFIIILLFDYHSNNSIFLSRKQVLLIKNFFYLCLFVCTIDILLVILLLCHIDFYINSDYGNYHYICILIPTLVILSVTSLYSYFSLK